MDAGLEQLLPRLRTLLDLRCNQGQWPAGDWSDTKLVVTQEAVDEFFSQMRLRIQVFESIRSRGKRPQKRPSNCSLSCAVLNELQAVKLHLQDQRYPLYVGLLAVL